jgi:bacterioferritin-associated ferredoxin
LTQVSVSCFNLDIPSDAGAFNPRRLETSVIVCSCAVITDRDIDRAVIEIMSSPPALLPTPGIVFRHLQKRMNCCRCAALTVSVIYSSMDRLEKDTRICPYALAEARRKLAVLDERRQRREKLELRQNSASRRATKAA